MLENHGKNNDSKHGAANKITSGMCGKIRHRLPNTNRGNVYNNTSSHVSRTAHVENSAAH
jgi:hypothetical protein